MPCYQEILKYISDKFREKEKKEKVFKSYKMQCFWLYGPV